MLPRSLRRLPPFLQMGSAQPLKTGVLSYSSVVSGNAPSGHLADDKSGPTSGDGGRGERPASPNMRIIKSGPTFGDGGRGERQASPNMRIVKRLSSKSVRRELSIQGQPTIRRYGDALQPVENHEHGKHTPEGYERKPQHQSHTGQEEEDHYILTLATDRGLHDAMTDIRAKHFPEKLNRIDAHLTLFQALPGSRLPEIEETIAALCKDIAPFDIQVRNARKMNKGVLVDLSVWAVKEIRRVHGRLREAWAKGGWLSEQDLRLPLRPHYTVQNKADDSELVEESLHDVTAMLEHLKSGPKSGLGGSARGIDMWLYQKGGTWAKHQSHPFTGPDQDGPAHSASADG